MKVAKRNKKGEYREIKKKRNMEEQFDNNEIRKLYTGEESVN